MKFSGFSSQFSVFGFQLSVVSFFSLAADFDLMLIGQLADLGFSMQDFHELKVWQKAHGLTLAVYRVTSGFPSAELYGLTSQLRRSSASISANLAEGYGRNSGADFARFCSIAMGSASETGVPPPAGEGSEADQGQRPRGAVAMRDRTEADADGAAAETDN
jgi:hypothetical protein